MNTQLDFSPVGPQIDKRDFKDVLSRFATGIAVATATDQDGKPIGMTINSFSSVSLDPPLVLWSIGLAAHSLPAFRRAGAFAINVLPSDKQHLCQQFATASADKFSGVDYLLDDYGLPLLAGMLAHLTCTTWRRYPGGDHEIFVGQVRSLQVGTGEPLVLYRGGLASLRPFDSLQEQGPER
jgi:flavin reductase (DIM6/NTAB) family NADH-FMN oxidoreductase RutF